jgi:hypothetical protein
VVVVRTRRDIRRGNARCPNVTLRIDAVTVHGFSRRDSLRIVDALRDELAAMIARGAAPAPQGSSAIEHIVADSVRVPRGASNRRIGRSLARSIWGGVRGG